MKTTMLFVAVALATTMTEAVAYDRLKEDTNNRVVLACAISDCTTIWNDQLSRSEQNSDRSNTTRPNTQQSPQQPSTEESEQLKTEELHRAKGAENEGAAKEESDH